MNKNFILWHSKKSELHKYKERPFFHEREVWFTSVGANIGFESDGKGDESIVILKKFNNETLWGSILTSTKKFGIYYFTFRHGEN